MTTYRIVIALDTEQKHEPRFLEQMLLLALGPKGIFPVAGTMRVTELVEVPQGPVFGPTGQTR